MAMAPQALHAQVRRERVAEALAEAWLNPQGCAWALRTVFGTELPPEQVYYDYEYDAFDGNGFVLKYLDAPVRMGLTWSEQELNWETSFQTSRAAKEAHGLYVWMEEHDVHREKLDRGPVDSLLEDTIRFFEVMAEWDSAPPRRPDPRFRFYANRVHEFLSRWDWSARADVESRLGARSYLWAPAAYRYAQESQARVSFIDATEAMLTLIRKDVRSGNGSWTTTCRLRAEPVGGLGVRALDDFSAEYLRFLATYGFGQDLLTVEDPDPFQYTASRLVFGHRDDESPPPVGRQPMLPSQ